MLRQQMADIKDACQKAGWEKVKAMQNAEKQGKDQSDMGTDVVHVPVPGTPKIRSKAEAKPVKEMADNSQT